MTAVLTLTPEELDLVLHGAIDEPRYRPFPSGRRSLAQDQEERDAETEGREQEWLTGPPATSFERLLSAQYWTRHGIEIAVLIAPEGGRSGSVVALARASGDRRGPADGTRWVKVGPWHLLPEPLPVETIQQSLTGQQRTWWQGRLAGRTAPLQPTLATAVENVLRRHIDDYDSLRRTLTTPARPRRRQEQLEKRDANATALSVLTRNWRSLRPRPVAEPTVLASAADDALAASEDDLITDDAAAFEDWAREARSVRGWWEFRYGHRQMLIKNVNAGRGEVETGADLVYVRTHPEAVVLVQYKLLAERATGTNYVRIDRRLSGQLDRMLRFATDSRTASTLDAYRLRHTYAFVKFVDPQGDTGLRDDWLTRGWYLPAEYVRAVLDSGPQGPRGGQSFDIDPERAISPSTFVDLVRTTWVGSTGDATSQLRAILQPRSRSLTIALDEPVESSRDR